MFLISPRTPRYDEREDRERDSRREGKRWQCDETRTTTTTTTTTTWLVYCLNRGSLPRRLALFTVAKLADSSRHESTTAYRGWGTIEKGSTNRPRALEEPSPSETYSARLWTNTPRNSPRRRVWVNANCPRRAFHNEYEMWKSVSLMDFLSLINAI